EEQAGNAGNRRPLHPGTRARLGGTLLARGLKIDDGSARLAAGSGEQALRHGLVQDFVEGRAQRLRAGGERIHLLAGRTIGFEPSVDLGAGARIELAVEIRDQRLVIRLRHHSYSFAYAPRPRAWPGERSAHGPIGS